jgi:hypothetical protein
MSTALKVSRMTAHMCRYGRFESELRGESANR